MMTGRDNTSVEHMKPDCKRLIMMTSGVFQIILGLLFLAFGGWAVISAKPSIATTAGAPFWLARLTLLCAYATVTIPRHYNEDRIILLIYALNVTCAAAISTTTWMFFRLLGLPSKSEDKFYISSVMVLSILAWLDTVVTYRAARSIKKSERRHRRRISRRRANPTYFNSSPLCFSHRKMFFGDEEFAPSPSEA